MIHFASLLVLTNLCEQLPNIIIHLNGMKQTIQISIDVKDEEVRSQLIALLSIEEFDTFRRK